MLQEIVYEAGKILKEGFYKKKIITFKGKVDLLTQYDIMVENYLKNEFVKEYKDFEFVGEESFKEKKIPQKAIIADPIDGTTNFVHSLPYVCISVALWENGETTEAAVYNPILEEFFYAKKGKGSFLNGKKIEVSKEKALINSLFATGFPYSKYKKSNDFFWSIKAIEKFLPKIRDIRRYGSAAIDLCYVACGKYEVFFEAGLKAWDVAAGILVLKEAGGEILNNKGQKYLFGDIIVATNGKITKDVLSILKDF